MFGHKGAPGIWRQQACLSITMLHMYIELCGFFLWCSESLPFFPLLPSPYFRFSLPHALSVATVFQLVSFAIIPLPPTNSSKMSLFMYSLSIQYLFVALPNFNFLIMVHFLNLAALMFLIITGTTLIAF